MATFNLHPCQCHVTSTYLLMIPRGSWTQEKPGKTFIQGFSKPYNFPKGWGQASNNYIQHIYSYSTLSNYPNTQHGRGNKFANAIGTHQQSLHNCSGNDVISGDYVGMSFDRLDTLMLKIEQCWCSWWRKHGEWCEGYSMPTFRKKTAVWFPIQISLSYISFLIVFQLCMRLFSGLSATSYLLGNISNF